METISMEKKTFDQQQNKRKKNNNGTLGEWKQAETEVNDDLLW
jgi:hypothetical protein